MRRRNCCTLGSAASSEPAPVRRMTTASECMIGSPKTSRPALRREVPVSTTSAMTWATPSSMAVSTAPSRWTTEASTPCSARWRATMPS